MSAEPTGPFVVACKLLFPLGSNGRPDDALRKAVGAIGEFKGARFVPEESLGAEFLQGGTGVSRISLVHPQFSSAAGYPNSWMSVSVDSYEPRAIGVIFVSIHMGKPGEQIDLEWSVGLDVMPRLVAELAPTLAFMTGRLVDEERVAFPAEEPLSGSSLPPEFTAWTYFDGDKLTSRMRSQLALLPAAVSRQLGRGWVVQAVERLQEAPSQEFLVALGSLARTIKYLGPVLEAGK